MTGTPIKNKLGPQSRMTGTPIKNILGPQSRMTGTPIKMTGTLIRDVKDLHLG